MAGRMIRVGSMRKTTVLLALLVVLLASGRAYGQLCFYQS